MDGVMTLPQLPLAEIDVALGVVILLGLIGLRLLRETVDIRRDVDSERLLRLLEFGSLPLTLAFLAIVTERLARGILF